MSKLVTFVADLFPYCVGDVVTLDDDELQRIDKEAKGRKLKSVYEATSTAPTESEAEKPAGEKPKTDAPKKPAEKPAAEKPAE